MAESEAMTSSQGVTPPHLTVVVRDLDVTYDVYEQPVLSARQLVTRGFRSRVSSTVEAIRSVSLDFAAGEAVGLVGSNGSGKSTLLRTIAGLQSKSAGHVFVTSQPQFLGVGAALKPRISGYRNVYLGGLAIGLGKREIAERMGEVIEFSGLGESMARPLNTYSSGMRARLAFSIATLRTPEILLLDEALAVGDRAFRERSIARINQIREDANTIILVSHNLNEIRETCDRAVWLNAGTIEREGDVESVLDEYEEWSDRNRS
jgi:teichoic acid transport system ATP-binding protein